VLTRIKIDKAAIDLVAAQGLGMDDVPPEGKMIKLTLAWNMSTGGISIARTVVAVAEGGAGAQRSCRHDHDQGGSPLHAAGLDPAARGLGES
jgi:cyanophycin synthetase